MMQQALHNAHDFTISQSELNLVFGNLNQTVVKCKHRREGSEDDSDNDLLRELKRNRQRSILDDFKEIRRGEMQILQLVQPDGLEDRSEDGMDLDCDWRAGSQMVTMRPTSKIEVVKIKKRRLMAITYEGVGAHERWREDFERYSRIREVNSWQLYAFTRSASPSLIFNQELVPLGQVYVNVPPIAQVYLQMRYLGDSSSLSDMKRKVIIGDQIYMNPEEVWINPSHGTLCYGPPSPHCRIPGLRGTYSSQIRVLAPFAHFHRQEAVIDYAQNALKADFHQLASLWRHSWDRYDTGSPKNLGSLIARRTGETVGYMPMYDENTTASNYDLRTFMSGVNPGHPKIVEGGWSRFSFKSLQDVFEHSRRKDSYCHRHVVVHETIRTSWFSQAAHIFHEMGVDELDFGNFGFASNIQYCVSLRDRRQNPSHHLMVLTHLLFSRAIFLFIPPLEEVRNDHGVLFHIKPHCLPFWSLDPFGKSNLREETCELIGLPELRVKEGIFYICFEPPASTAIKDYQKLKGYNPYTNEYAQEHGWPLFQFAPGFEAVVQRELEAVRDDQYPGLYADREAIRSDSDSDNDDDLESSHAPQDSIPGILLQSSTSMKYHTTDCIGTGVVEYLNDSDEMDEVENLLMPEELGASTRASRFLSREPIPHMGCMSRRDLTGMGLSRDGRRTQGRKRSSSIPRSWRSHAL